MMHEFERSPALGAVFEGVRAFNHRKHKRRERFQARLKRPSAAPYYCSPEQIAAAQARLAQQLPEKELPLALPAAPSAPLPSWEAEFRAQTERLIAAVQMPLAAQPEQLRLL
jgi:hypothetical protein